MQFVDRYIKDLKLFKERRDKGLYNSIPFPLERIDEVLPGIVKGLMYIITASSGVGKTQLTKFLFVTNVYNFVKNNPSTKAKILYYALEESKEEFLASIIQTHLKIHHNITIDNTTLKSLGNSSLSQEHLDIIEKSIDYYKDFFNICDVIDDISNPYGIYKNTMDYVKRNGKIHKKKISYADGTEVEVFDRYEPNHPDHYMIMIVDHISLIEQEKKHNSMWDAIVEFSSKYCRQELSKKYGVIPVLVQQQAADKEKTQHTNTGNIVIEKLIASLDALGDCKLTTRDAFVVLGLTSLSRYNVGYYGGINNRKYAINKMGDSFRLLTILKNRLGRVGQLCLYFNGAVNEFHTLPDEITEDMYEEMRELRWEPKNSLVKLSAPTSTTTLNFDINDIDLI